MDQEFKLGELYYDKLDYDNSVKHLNVAAQGFFARGLFTKYLDCLNYLLRIYADRIDSQNINSTKEKLQDLLLLQGFELNARTYYTLAKCAVLKNQIATAQSYLEKSLALAKTNESTEDICNASIGLASIFRQAGQFEEALGLIDSVKDLLRELPKPDTEISAHIIRSNIYRDSGRFEEALAGLWKCYEVLKTHQSIYIHVYLMYNLGLLFEKSGQKDSAMIYLSLARRSIDPVNMADLKIWVDKALARLGETEETYDLVYDEPRKLVTERVKGPLDFKNQFILLDLLKILVEKPGEVKSKENLAKSLWGEAYDPSVHDNKLYVTIKRLRAMIEPNVDKPTYILRAKNGYCLNKDRKVLIKGGDHVLAN